MRKGDGEMKTEMSESKAAEKFASKVSLAFRVIPDASGLFAAEILMLENDLVVGKRHGIFTTLGHAIGAADDLMDGWAFNEIEQKPEDYFKNVYL